MLIAGEAQWQLQDAFLWFSLYFCVYWKWSVLNKPSSEDKEGFPKES